jgi:hypothetical protein
MVERQQSGTKSARRHIKSVLLLVLLIVLFVFVSWLNNTPKIIILGPTANRELLQTTAVYKKAAIKLLNESFTNHNKLTLNTDNIVSKLEQEFPELANVTVQFQFLGDSPDIYLQPATPVMLMANSTGNEYIIATSGVAVAPASKLNNLAMFHLLLVTDQSDLTIRPGEAALSSSDIVFIQTIKEQLTAHNLTISSLTLPSASSELDVHINGSSYFIKFNLVTDADQQIGSFLAVRKYLASNSISPSQYIDVRVLGRAFYK